MPPQKKPAGTTATVTGPGSASLGTLAAGSTASIVGPTMTRGGTLLSARGTISVHDVTAGDGPWLFGIRTNDLSDAEWEAFLNQAGPVSPSGITEMELSERGKYGRTLGTLVPSGNGTVAGVNLDNQSLSGLKFSEEAPGWRWWIYNCGKTMTTGATFRSRVQHFVRFNPSG